MSLGPCRIAALLRQVCTALLKGYCLQLRVAESPFRLVPPGQSHACFFNTWLHMYLYIYLYVCVYTCIFVYIFIYTYRVYSVYYHVLSLSYFDFDYDFSHCQYYHSIICKYSYMSMFPLNTFNILQVKAHKGLFMSKSKMLFQVLPAIFVMTWREGIC